MLTITATDFGLAPSDIQIKDYSNANLLVLDGEFTVDMSPFSASKFRLR